MMSRAAILPFLALALTVSGCVTEVDGGELEETTQEAQDAVTPCATPERSCNPGEQSWAQMGVQYCTENDQGEEEWTECCGFGTAQCECTPPWAGDDWQCNTPLVLAFNKEAVRYTSEMSGSFDLTGAGQSVAMDWPTAATPWLALDRDGNGSIDNGGELFGSATKLNSYQSAPNGFYALGLLDDNRDGVIDARDEAFAKLLVWRDADANRSSSTAELSPAATEIAAISLSYSVDSRCDERGNCQVERAAMRFLDSSGREREGHVVDVHLAKQ